MLAQTKEIGADLIGQNALFDHLIQHDMHRLGLPIRAIGHIAKGVDTEFNKAHLGLSFLPVPLSRSPPPRKPAD